MNIKTIIEEMNNGYVNLFKEGIFYRAYEYSALALANITKYKIMLDLDKKANKILITIGFPQNKLESIEEILKNKNIPYRIFEKNENKNKVVEWENFIEIDKQQLTETKQKLIKF